VSGTPRNAWLYTRGADSVRLVREERSNGCSLFVYGPGSEAVTHAFANVAQCITGQAAIEQNLFAEGYQFTRPESDRRTPGMWLGPDHRRLAGG
jgi:hypothetical protein